MKVEIIAQIKNPSMKREEYILKLYSDKNPTKTEIIDAVKKDGTLTVVKKVVGSYGSESFDSEVFVYENKEAMDRIETLSRKTRDKIKEEAKKAAEAAKAAENKPAEGVTN